MNGQAVTYHPNGAVETVPIRNTRPSLDFLQTCVGGCIEIVPYFNSIGQGDTAVPCVAFCNDLGKIQKLPHNNPATHLWRAAQAREKVEIADYLVGNVVVITGDEELMENL
jgi:hypothetical protein